MQSIARQITAIGRLMFERRLTDIAGGNISARQGDRIYITPTGAGQKWRWELAEEDILCARLDSDELLSDPQHSKESISHLLVYRAYPQVGAIIHAHPFHIMPFTAALKPIPPLTLPAQHFGEIDFIADAPSYSRQQAELLVTRLAPMQELMERMAAAIMIPKHGIFIAGKSLDTAIDCLERIDNSAWYNLAVKILA